MNSRYANKLQQHGTARNQAETASKVRGIKWTISQRKKIQMFAALEETPTLELLKQHYSGMGEYKLGRMLAKVKESRKSLANALNRDEIKGIRNSVGSGTIYLLEHEMHPGWIKCGMTTNVKSRLSTYNCSDPLKRFKMITQKQVSDRRSSEIVLMNDLMMQATVTKREWFKIDRIKAIEIFNKVQ